MPEKWPEEAAPGSRGPRSRPGRSLAVGTPTPALHTCKGSPAAGKGDPRTALLGVGTASRLPLSGPGPAHRQGGHRPVLEATTLSCCTSGLSSFPAFSLLLLFLLRPAGGAVWKRPRLGGRGLPRRRYRASISCFCWLCSSEISFRCLREGRVGDGHPARIPHAARPGERAAAAAGGAVGTRADGPRGGDGGTEDFRSPSGPRGPHWGPPA